MTRTATIGFEPMNLAVKVLCLTGLGQVALYYLFYGYSLFKFKKYFFFGILIELSDVYFRLFIFSRICIYISLKILYHLVLVNIQNT